MKKHLLIITLFAFILSTLSLFAEESINSKETHTKEHQSTTVIKKEEPTKESSNKKMKKEKAEYKIEENK